MTAAVVLVVGCATPDPAAGSRDERTTDPVTVTPEVPTESPFLAPGTGIERVLFDGRDLSQWELGVYGEDAEYELRADGVVVPQTAALAGLTYRGDLPVPPYRLEVEATKLYGADFFLGLTFPVRDGHLTLVLGGWGGMVSGLSSLDGLDAARNHTKTLRHFPNGKRQVVTVDVDDTEVRVAVDGEPFLGTDLEGRQVSLRVEVEPSRPLGIATFATSTLLHRVTVVEAPAAAPRAPR